MKVRLLQSISSPTYSYAVGQVVETSKDRGNQFVKHGIAEVVETAKAKPVKETATKKSASKKAKKGDDDADND
ncbi:hypothetical protein [Sporosarcina newyorkensis]|uniref:Uncharacterized protein n=1 Tax=Sporosarcina newyorkensis TaxID=759851 RepID=A0A1T4YTY3_9BACL|nr:hypothetical protein [Sporosarcina newyorkensis]SKB05123.1 hypothetical protein SAMN04244570_3564 [Sporosarcina newyorkensis]